MTPVQCLGTEVSWRPFATARSWQTWDFPGRPDRAQWRASIISQVLAGTYVPEPETPLWVVMVTWMLHDGPRLDPGSFPIYASDIKRINEAIGTCPLTACDRIPYQGLFDALDAADASESARRAVARTMGTICSWAQDTEWWPYAHEMFGHHASRQKIRMSAFKKGHDADVRSGRIPTKIEASLCPEFDETLRFSKVLGDFAVERWGKQAIYLGDSLTTQYVTGARFGELLVLEPGAIRLDSPQPFVGIHSQYDKNLPAVDGLLALKAPKNGKSRDAAIWSSAVDELNRIVSNARQAQRVHIFQSPKPELKTFPRQFISMYAAAAEEANYEYTSHWHRHAYASYNLASPEEGGYGRSLKPVSIWLGHSNTQITDARYWHPVGQEPGWSDHLPGVRL